MNITATLENVTTMNSYTDTDGVIRVGRVVILERSLDPQRTSHGVEAGAKDDQEAVSHRLDLATMMFGQYRSDEIIVGFKPLQGTLISVALRERRRADHVREQDGTERSGQGRHLSSSQRDDENEPIVRVRG
jgi:hypothetical protein